MSIDQLQTPSLLIDLDRVDANIARLAEYGREHGIAVRPHVKTHKTPEIAALQLHAGAVGLTCATAREAEVMSKVCDDLLVAYPAVDPMRADRLMNLPRNVRIAVALDSAHAIDVLDAAARRANRDVGVLIEIDAGMHRTGVTDPAEAIRLAAAVSHTTQLEYRGIAFYPGHIRDAVQGDAIAELRDLLHRFVSQLTAAGFPPTVVSGGSTPTLWRTHELDVVTELRAGTCVYNDRTTAAIGACNWNDCAATVMTTVVSTAVPRQFVVDAGVKALGREPMRGTDGNGYAAMADRPEVVVSRMSEEHGIIDTLDSEKRPDVGQRILLVPNHVCIAVHNFDRCYAVRGDTLVGEWRVAARGR